MQVDELCFSNHVLTLQVQEQTQQIVSLQGLEYPQQSAQNNDLHHGNQNFQHVITKSSPKNQDVNTMNTLETCMVVGLEKNEKKIKGVQDQIDSKTNGNYGDASRECFEKLSDQQAVHLAELSSQLIQQKTFIDTIMMEKTDLAQRLKAAMASAGVIYLYLDMLHIYIYIYIYIYYS